jgi:hypothetical protein
MTAPTMETRTWWRQPAELAVRRLAACTAAGALSGLLVAGAGGRFAMFVLAQANPKAQGMESDDGFVMGQFTMAGTLNLLVVGTVIGILGGGVYFVLRGLMIGPRWFEILSISGAAAVVVGSMLIHADGVDFILLEPPLLPIAMFVAIPGIYAVLLTLLAERWLAPGGAFVRAAYRRTLSVLILWLPLAPVLLVLVAGWAIGALLRRAGPLASAGAMPAWVARFALTGVFIERLLALTSDVTVLT